MSKINLSTWNKIIKQAIKRGHFTKKAEQLIRNPHACLNGELAKALGTSYTHVHDSYETAASLEGQMMDAILFSDSPRAAKIILENFKNFSKEILNE